MSKQGTTKIETIIVALVVISIIISSGTVYYTASLMSQLVASTENLEDLLTGIEGLTDAEREMADALSKLGVDIADIEERLLAVEEALKPPLRPKIFTCTTLAAHWFITPMGVADPQWSGGALPTPTTLVYETLFDLDPTALRERKFKTIPWLAESYSASEDGLEYTIKLRHGVKFHTGNEMKADDVVYSLSRFGSAHFGFEYPVDITGVPHPDGWAYYLPSIESVEVIDDYTFLLRTKYRDPGIIDELSFPYASIVDKETCEEHAIIGADGKSDHGYTWLYKESNDAGTGPYKIKDFKLTERYEVTRFDDYWGGPPKLSLPTPKIDTIICLAISEDADARMKLVRGDLLAVSDLTPDTISALMDIRPTDVSPAFTYMGLWMHTAKGPLSDWRVRKAIKMAIDYNALADDVMLGTANVVQGAYLKGMEGWEETARYFPGADYTGAMALLDEAGYLSGPDGWRFEIELVIRPAPRFGMDFYDVALAMQSDLAEIGVKVNIGVYEVGEYYDKIFDPSMPEMMWLQPDAFSRLGEPGWFWQFLIEPSASFEYGWNETTQTVYPYQVEYFKETYPAILAESDRAKRIEMWKEFDAYMLEYGPMITVVSNCYRTAYSEKVENFFFGPKQIFPAIFYIDLKD